MLSRLMRLIIGQTLYGVGAALVVRAGLGVDPWTVLAQGISRHSGVGVGWVTNVLGLVVLLAWIPLRQRPRVGTVVNILLVGTAMQGALAVLPRPVDAAAAVAALSGGILLIAVASGFYLGADLGAGPRDGLMTGLHTRVGWPLWLCRAVVEGGVLTLGWMLGGTVGVGTLAFAVTIGPLVHGAMRALAPRTDPPSLLSAGGTAATPSPA